jgi:hypothetical protein
LLIKFLTLNNKNMNELSIERMEMVSGGGCRGLSVTAFTIGAIGLSLGVAAVFVTGGAALGVLLASQALMLDGVALGLGAVSLAKC